MASGCIPFATWSVTSWVKESNIIQLSNQQLLNFMDFHTGPPFPIFHPIGCALFLSMCWWRCHQDPPLSDHVTPLGEGWVAGSYSGIPISVFLWSFDIEINLNPAAFWLGIGVLPWVSAIWCHFLMLSHASPIGKRIVASGNRHFAISNLWRMQMESPLFLPHCATFVATITFSRGLHNIWQMRVWFLPSGLPLQSPR